MEPITTTAALLTLAGYPLGLAADFTQHFLCKPRVDVARLIKRRGSNPENHHVERSAYRAHLAASLVLIEETLGSKADRSRWVGTDPDRLTLEYLKDSVNTHINGLNSKVYHSFLPDDNMGSFTRKQLEASFDEFDNADNIASIRELTIQHALEDLARRLECISDVEGACGFLDLVSASTKGTSQPDLEALPKGLVDRFKSDKEGYLKRLQYFAADEIKHADSEFFRIFSVKQQFETKAELIDIRNSIRDLSRSNLSEELVKRLDTMSEALGLIPAIKETVEATQKDVHALKDTTKEIKKSVETIDSRNSIINYLLQFPVGNALPKQTQSYLAYRFEARKTAFVGREQELEQLYGFLDDERPFLWWQIAGEGGQGKSRLALNLVDRLEQKKFWDSGFIDIEKINWRTVTIEKQTLCIVDYIASPKKIDAFSHALMEFNERITRSNDSTPIGKLRILVIERALYSFKQAENMPSASWFEQLRKNGKAEQAAYEHVFNEAGPLELESLTAEAMCAIADSWRQAQSPPLKKLDGEQKSRLLDALRGRANQNTSLRAWRPLFAMMYSVNIDKDYSKYSSNKDLKLHLLEKTLATEMREYWQTPKPSHQAKNLACLATILGELHLGRGELQDESTYKVFDDDTITEAWMCLGQNVIDPSILNIGGEVDVPLTGRQPDLLGEYMIVWALSDSLGVGRRRNAKRQNHLQKIMQDAWAIDSDATLSFLTRMAEDFRDHPATKAMMKVESLDKLEFKGNFPSAITASLLGIEWLLERTFLESKNAQDDPDFGLLCIIVAIVGENIECVQRLIQMGVDINKRSEYRNPLNFAVSMNQTRMVKALIRAGADVNATDKFGNFPLYIAAAEGHVDCIKILARAGADVNKYHQNGTFPLIALVASTKEESSDTIETLQALIDAGADINQVTRAPIKSSPPA